METKILFDENISSRLAEFLHFESRKTLNVHLAHLRQLGWSGQADIVWIPRAVQSGFVIVTGDRNERTRGYTVADLHQMGAKVILLSPFWDHSNRWERAKWLVSRLEQILRLAQQMQAGEVRLLYKTGRSRKL